MPFWKKVFGKKEDKAKNRDVKHTTEIEESKASPAGEKRNFNYNLSVSRSGRYKSKERKRTALTENPALFDDADKNRAQFDNGVNNERPAVANNNSSSSNSGTSPRETKSATRTSQKPGTSASS